MNPFNSDQKRNCNQCEKDISHMKANAVRCSKKCNNAARDAEHAPHNCAMCQRDISQLHPNARFCGPECRADRLIVRRAEQWLDPNDEETVCKQCSGCRDWVPLSGFGRSTGHTADGYHQKCRDCRGKRDREYYDREREHLVDSSRRSRAIDRARRIDLGPGYVPAGRLEARRDRLREWARSHKQREGCRGTLDGPCPYGVTDPRVLEFDHTDSNKTGNVSTLVGAPASLERVQAEAAKCVVRCRNCHAIVTFQRAGSAPHRLHVRNEQTAR